MSGETLDNINPATGQVHSKIPRSAAADVEAAVTSAAAAAAGAKASSLASRAALLERVAGIIEDNLDAFAMAESKDSGKPLKLAQNVDIPRAVANLR